MHWLPLVAMVIASALPFPHNPVSWTGAATTRRERRRDQAAGLAVPPLDYDSRGTAALSRHGHRQNLRTRKDYLQSSVDEDTSNMGTSHSSSSGGDVMAGGVSKGLTLPKRYRADSGRQGYSGPEDFSKKDDLQDPTESPVVGPGTDLRTRAEPQATGPSETGHRRAVGAGRRPTEQDSLNLEAGLGLDSVLEGDEMLEAHPRVLFSPSPPEHPPFLLMLETGVLDEGEDTDRHIEGHGDRAIESPESAGDATELLHPIKRDKRSHLMDRRRGEKSVCEAESVWVTNKTTAVDSYNVKVTILQEIQTQTGPLKQFFYETRCRPAEQRSGAGGSRGPGAAARPAGTGVAGAGCLGVDKKQWVSECKAKQSFVRALTKDANNRVGWRWIRIDSSCVCVLLSRANQAAGREVLSRMGRG